MANEYVLVERTSRRGRNGVTFWRFTFYCLEDGLFWETTVDNTYDNFKKSGWDHLADDPNPWGVYTGLTRTKRTTREGMPVITADSKPRVETRCESRDEAIAIVAADKGIILKKNQFGEMFEWHDE